MWLLYMWLLSSVAMGSHLNVDWSSVQTASLVAGVNETVMFSCSSGKKGASCTCGRQGVREKKEGKEKKRNVQKRLIRPVPSECSVTSVASVVDRSPDVQPGAFDLDGSPNVTLAITTMMAGRTYVIRDRFDEAKLAYLIVSGGRNVFVKVAPPFVNLDIDVGVRVLFECDDECLANNLAAGITAVWIAEANAAGQVLPPVALPFIFGPETRYFPISFEAARRFYYVSPTLSNVGGVITVGDPQELPYRGIDLDCRCNFPSCGPEPVPCDVLNATGPAPLPPYLPEEPTIPPAQLCLGPTSAKCPSIQGFAGAAVWGASAAFGSDCAPSDTRGSVAEPFGSIGLAVCAASDGDVVVVDVQPSTYYEDMLVWDRCVSCVSWLLEDSITSALGHATLRSGGIVTLRKSQPDWPNGNLNLIWTNVHRFSRLKNGTLPMPIN